MSTLNRRRHLLPEMEGFSARWYARQRGTPSQIAIVRRQAAQLTEGMPNGAVLEVAPGPGYFAIEIARLGRFQVTGLDISHTMVEISKENAAAAGVNIEFRHGDATEMPFADGSFDLVVSQAAFKNFKRPLNALNEMHRVLRAGGRAVIQDLRKEASEADIDLEVENQNVGAVSGFISKRILAWLRNRAYSASHFESLVAESNFRTCAIRSDGIGLEVRLEKS
jgi:ubiquinone/menaquinone biosynthesis C-methylase UbiE